MKDTEFKTPSHFTAIFNQHAGNPEEQLKLAKRYASQNYKRGLLHKFNSNKR